MLQVRLVWVRGVLVHTPHTACGFRAALPAAAPADHALPRLPRLRMLYNINA